VLSQANVIPLGLPTVGRLKFTPERPVSVRVGGSTPPDNFRRRPKIEDFRDHERLRLSNDTTPKTWVLIGSYVTIFGSAPDVGGDGSQSETVLMTQR
jgi:hypothetical protein